jgi:hypothetical protein
MEVIRQRGITKPKLWEYLSTLREAEAVKFEGDADGTIIELVLGWKL